MDFSHVEKIAASLSPYYSDIRGIPEQYTTLAAAVYFVRQSAMKENEIISAAIMIVQRFSKEDRRKILVFHDASRFERELPEIYDVCLANGKKIRGGLDFSKLKNRPDVNVVWYRSVQCANLSQMVRPFFFLTEDVEIVTKAVRENQKKILEVGRSVECIRCGMSKAPNVVCNICGFVPSNQKAKLQAGGKNPFEKPKVGQGAAPRFFGDHGALLRMAQLLSEEKLKNPDIVQEIPKKKIDFNINVGFEVIQDNKFVLRQRQFDPIPLLADALLEEADEDQQ